MAPRSESNGHGLATRMALASLSASLSETATFPIDTIKTRLQLLRASAPSRSNLLLVSSEIFTRGGGLLGFYSGLAPAILRHLHYTPIRIVGYENLRGFAVAADGDVSLLGQAIAGGASGVFAQVN